MIKNEMTAISIGDEKNWRSLNNLNIQIETEGGNVERDKIQILKILCQKTIFNKNQYK